MGKRIMGRKINEKLLNRLIIEGWISEGNEINLNDGKLEIDLLLGDAWLEDERIGYIVISDGTRDGELYGDFHYACIFLA